MVNNHVKDTLLSKTILFDPKDEDRDQRFDPHSDDLRENKRKYISFYTELFYLFSEIKTMRIDIEHQLSLVPFSPTEEFDENNREREERFEFVFTIVCLIDERGEFLLNEYL